MSSEIKSIAKNALLIEAKAVAGLEKFIDDQFVAAVETVMQSKGRFVVSGIGKSAIIAQKIVATCNSTGTPSIYLHAADAIHGDSGMIGPEDVVMIISKSGESPEIKLLIDLISNFGNPLIAMVGNTDSYLGKSTKLVVNTTVDQEACIHNLAPTSSTTAQMVMGDLMAIALMELKGFKSNDFAKFHPGGNLGKRLTLTAGAIAKNNTQPSVQPTTSIKEVISTISKNRMGATAVLDDTGKIIGMITDGDIRRMLEQHNSIQDLKAADVFHKQPIKIASNTLAIEAFDIMKAHDISQLIVADAGQYKGMIHIHDLMKEGIL
ncbi:MAG: KpsF/GutQ family sugar-phosphate isomerase [Chitinophagia bacterium]